MPSDETGSRSLLAGRRLDLNDSLLEFLSDPLEIALEVWTDRTRVALLVEGRGPRNSVEQVARSRLLTPIPVSRNAEGETAVLSPEHVEETLTDVRDQVERVRELVAMLSEEVAAARNEATLSEEEIREIVRDEPN